MRIANKSGNPYGGYHYEADYSSKSMDTEDYVTNRSGDVKKYSNLEAAQKGAKNFIISELKKNK